MAYEPGHTQHNTVTATHCIFKKYSAVSQSRTSRRKDITLFDNEKIYHDSFEACSMIALQTLCITTYLTRYSQVSRYPVWVANVHGERVRL